MKNLNSNEIEIYQFPKQERENRKIRNPKSHIIDTGTDTEKRARVKDLSGELLPWSLASCGFTSGLLCTGHY